MEKSLNKMGTMPINKLILSIGTPMILSMVLQAFYNIVDSAFVSAIPGGIGESALNALTLAFPVQMLMVAVSIGTGVGTNVLLSKSLGQGDQEKAGRVAGCSLFLCCVIYAICLLFGIFGVRAYISTQTVNSQIFNLAVDYLKICCILSPGIVFFSIYEKMLQATGLSLYSTIAQVSGAVLNIVLDPILIFGYFGMPELGVKGAAYATVIGQIASFLIALFFHIRFNRAVPNKLKYIKPSANIIRGIYAIGFPAIIAQALMSFMTYGFNIILVRVDEALVTAYGLFYKIQQFILFAAFGLRDAITPIISFSHGMKNKERIRDGIRYGLQYTVGIMLIGMVLLEVFARSFSGIFGLSGFTQSLCISAMRIISLSFIFAGLNVAFQGIFQALDAGAESLIISVCRQILFVLPVAWLFSLAALRSIDHAWMIWMTFPIAEILSAAIACMLMKKIYRNTVLEAL